MPTTRCARAARAQRTSIRIDAMHEAEVAGTVPRLALTERLGHELRPLARADLILEIGPSEAILRAHTMPHVLRVTGMEPGSTQALTRGEALEFVAYFDALEYPLADMSVEFLAENPKAPAEVVR